MLKMIHNQPLRRPHLAVTLQSSRERGVRHSMIVQAGTQCLLTTSVGVLGLSIATFGTIQPPPSAPSRQTSRSLGKPAATAVHQRRCRNLDPIVRRRPSLAIPPPWRPSADDEAECPTIGWAWPPHDLPVISLTSANSASWTIQLASPHRNPDRPAAAGDSIREPSARCSWEASDDRHRPALRPPRHEETGRGR